MAAPLAGKRIAFLTANEGVEQVELTKPWKAVQAAGGDAVLLAPEAGEVQAFNRLDKGSTLIDAGLVLGRRLTSWPSLTTDLTNAGAGWLDEAVVVDTSGPNMIVSSRKPDDLPMFSTQLVETFASTLTRT